MSSYFGDPICFFEKKLGPAGSLITSAVAPPPAGDLTIPTSTPSSVSMNRPGMIESSHHLLVNPAVRGNDLIADCTVVTRSSSITLGGVLRAHRVRGCYHLTGRADPPGRRSRLNPFLRRGTT